MQVLAMPAGRATNEAWTAELDALGVATTLVSVRGASESWIELACRSSVGDLALTLVAGVFGSVGSVVALVESVVAEAG